MSAEKLSGWKEILQNWRTLSEFMPNIKEEVVDLERIMFGETIF